jgi:hypothetical protein
MSNLLHMNVLDVGRAFGSDPDAATPDTVADWLLSEYTSKRRGGSITIRRFTRSTTSSAVRRLLSLRFSTVSRRATQRAGRTTPKPSKL